MNAQLYTSASGLIVQERRMEMIANNLANLSTTGFRSQRTVSASYWRPVPDAPAEARLANTGVALAGEWEVAGPGPLLPTGRALDVALEPDQLLVVQTAGGRRYTRAGSLEVTSEGRLADALGHPLLNREGKPIEGLGPNSEIKVDGRIVDEDTEIGRLLVVRHDPALLRREGDSLLTAAGNDAALQTVDAPALQPGHIEGSAAQAVVELVELIQTQRAFESYQKLISLTMNEVNRKTVNEIAG